MMEVFHYYYFFLCLSTPFGNRESFFLNSNQFSRSDPVCCIELYLRYKNKNAKICNLNIYSDRKVIFEVPFLIIGKTK